MPQGHRQTSAVSEIQIKSLRERLQNPTSTQLPLFCSPNLVFLSRDLEPTIRDSVFVTRHFWMCMIFSKIVWGWVKRLCEGGSFGRAHRGGRVRTLDLCGCGLTASSLHLRLFYFAEQTKSRTWVWIDGPAARHMGRAGRRMDKHRETMCFSTVAYSGRGPGAHPPG